MKKLIALGTLIVGLAIIALLLPLHRVQSAIADMGAWAPTAAVATGALLLCALVPRTAISVACGVLFGALSGGLVAVVAALLAAAATFWLGRALGREALAALQGDRLGRLDGWLARRGLLGVTVVRLMPLAPYGLIGYAYGTTSVPRWNYLGGTAIGAAPSAFTYAAVGAAVVRPGALGWLTLIPAGVGLLVALGAFGYWRRSGAHRQGDHCDTAGRPLR